MNTLATYRICGSIKTTSTGNGMDDTPLKAEVKANGVSAA